MGKHPGIKKQCKQTSDTVPLPFCLAHYNRVNMEGQTLPYFMLTRCLLLCYLSYRHSTFLGGLFSRGKKGSPVKPPVPDNTEKLLPVTQPMRHQGTHSFSFTTLWNNELFSDVIIHHNQMVYHTHTIVLFSQCKLFTTHFNNNNESVNGSTSSVASKLTDAIKQSTFFTSASMERLVICVIE